MRKLYNVSMCYACKFTQVLYKLKMLGLLVLLFTVLTSLQYTGVKAESCKFKVGQKFTDLQTVVTTVSLLDNEQYALTFYTLDNSYFTVYTKVQKVAQNTGANMGNIATLAGVVTQVNKNCSQVNVTNWQYTINH